MPDKNTAMKTVWVLGAGASASHSTGALPLLLQIPAKAKELGLLSRRFTGLNQLSTYIRKRFNAHLQRGPRLNLEDVLTFLELDIAASPEASLIGAQAFLLRLIRNTIMACQKEILADVGDYVDLASRLRASPIDSVVTFNWDTLLDDAMGRRTKIHPERDRRLDPTGQYGRFLQAFTGLGDGTIKGLDVPQPVTDWIDTEGVFLKAHGSVDWFHCTNQSCRNHGRLFPVPDKKTVPLCGSCLERTAVVIVPPTLNKRLREVPSIRRIWNVAAREVSHAERLVIWGYSIPPTDYASSWLLRHSDARRLTELVVINPGLLKGKTSVSLNADFLRRYTTLVSKTVRLTLFYDYKDFANGLDLLAKYPGLKGVRGISRVVGTGS
jgi:hypothetical protein